MYTYSVMQSDGNSFCGDVVSDSFNKQSRDENNILDQIYESTYARIIIMMIFILYNIIKKCLLIGTTVVALKPNLMIHCCYALYLYECTYFQLYVFTAKIQNLYNKVPKIFAFHIFSLKCCLHHYI